MCLLQDQARRFIETLNLPFGLLKHDGHICYCDECKTYYRSAGFIDDNYPDYNYPNYIYPDYKYPDYPVDWYLFKVNIRVPPGTSLEEISNKWHLCFHGTEVPRLKSLLLLGLKIPGDTDWHGRQISELEGHVRQNDGPHGYDTKKIFVSPSIWYAGTDIYARPYCYKSKTSGFTYRVKVVLMVRICPEKYVASGSTIETWSTWFLDLWRYRKDSIEWSTKDRESVVITGVLVRFERYQCTGHGVDSCFIF